MVTIQFRTDPRSDDAAVWDAVVTKNEYRLPDDMGSWRVLDIGAAIGAFSYACCRREAWRVLAAEPDPTAKDYYLANLADYHYLATAKGKERAVVKLLPCAVAERSVEEECTLYSGLTHSGNSLYITHRPGPKVPVVSFASLVETQPEWELCKIDAEAAEYPILLHTPVGVLRKVARYVVECHAPRLYEELERRMTDVGYRETDRAMNVLGECHRIYWWERKQ